MAATKRTQNYCKDCGDTWYPRGRYLSNKCPNCGSTDVDLDYRLEKFVVKAILWICGVGVCLAFLAGQGNSPEPALDSQTTIEYNKDR